MVDEGVFCGLPDQWGEKNGLLRTYNLRAASASTSARRLRSCWACGAWDCWDCWDCCCGATAMGCDGPAWGADMKEASGWSKKAS